MSRTSAVTMRAEGWAALGRALSSLGYHAAVEPGSSTRGRLSLDGQGVAVQLDVAAVITPEVARRVVDAEPTHTHIAVGDLITAPAKEVLREAGWGWLDRRGHLVVRAPGILVDAAVPSDPRHAAAPTKVISGTAAISWAAALLLSPDKPPSMREVARRIGISHSVVVTAAKRLRDASLVDDDGRPLVPELFWSLAEVWRPEAVALAEMPDPAGPIATLLGLRAATDEPGWAVAGTVGAMAWGAPVAARADYPIDFYVPSPATLRQATLRLGEARRFEQRACTVAVAPTPLVCAERIARRIVGHHDRLVAHGLFAALDLAQDRARGVEILEAWDPEEFTRVW